jgi:hypothetical protein
LQVEPGHPWHPHIQNQTGRVFQLSRVKEILDGGKDGGPESRRPNQAADRFPDARVVIHDPDQ